MPFKFLSSKVALSDYYFSVPRLCFASMGYWPEAPHALWASANFMILFIGVFTEIHAGISCLQTDLATGLDTLCPAGTSLVTLLKMLLIWYYRRDLKFVLCSMKQMLYGGGTTAAKQQILRKHSVMAARLNFAPFMMGFITCTSYNLKPLLLAWMQWWLGSPVVWKTPFNMTLPSVLLRAPYFPLAYAFTAYTGYITIFMFGGCDAFYFEFCAYTAVLLQMLQQDIAQAFEICAAKMQLSTADAMNLKQHLRRIVERHNHIIDLKHFFVKRYAVITMAHFVSAGLVIGASIFDLLNFTGLGMMIYILYTIASLGELFIYCYGGTLVAESSVQLASVVYNCDWHICPPDVRRMLILILIRSQRPLTMAVPFFTPSLAAFMSILQTSGSIIALVSSFQ